LNSYLHDKTYKPRRIVSIT